MIKSNLKLRSISESMIRDPELVMVEDHLGGILGILLGAPIKQIRAAASQERALKKSILLRFTGNIVIEIQLHSLSTRKMFRGILDLAQQALTNPSLQLEEISPGTLLEPTFQKSISIQTAVSSENLTISCEGASLQNLPKESIGASNLLSKLDASEVELTLSQINEAEPGDANKIIARSAVGVMYKGEITEFGDLIIKEVVMSEDKLEQEIRAEIKVGSITMKLKDLLELRPGSLIEIDWSKDSYGVLYVGGKEWAKVNLNIANGLLSLNIPADATFNKE